MQAAKKAVENIKETAANIGASAKSGLDNTKATVQEKSEWISAHDPLQKEMATKKKEEKINQAEMEKQEAREQNAAAKMAATADHVTEGHGTTTTTTGPATKCTTVGDYGSAGQPMPADQTPIISGLGHEEDVVGSQPIESNTGMSATTAHVDQTVHGSGPPN